MRHTYTKTFFTVYLKFIFNQGSCILSDHPTKTWTFKTSFLGFPGGAVVEGLPASAGDTGSGPGLGGPHMLRNGWARGPQLLSLRVWSLCSAAGGATIMRGPRTAVRSGPRLPQLGRALAQKRRPNTAINK